MAKTTTKPYAWRVVYLKQSRAGAGHEQTSFVLKGSQTTARLRAPQKRGFVRIVRVEPLSLLEYEHAFPEPAK